jgi:hypothetical protein
MDTTGKAALQQGSGKVSAGDFSSEELDAIMKFGAADLFKEETAEETDSRLEEMDLDLILNNAETHDTDHAAENGISSELLSAFNTVDIATNEDEVDERLAPLAKSWDEIIPEEDRKRVQQEEEDARLREMYLGPRNRKQVSYQEGGEGEAAAKGKPKPKGKGTASESPTTTPTPAANKPPKKPPKAKKRMPGAIEAISDAGFGDFLEDEVKATYLALRKFGSMPKLFNQVVKAADMTHRTPKEVQSLVNWLVKASTDVSPSLLPFYHALLPPPRVLSPGFLSSGSCACRVSLPGLPTPVGRSPAGPTRAGVMPCPLPRFFMASMPGWQLSDGNLTKDSKRSRTMLEITPKFKFKVDEFLIRLRGIELVHDAFVKNPDWRVVWQASAPILRRYLP